MRAAWALLALSALTTPAWAKEGPKRVALLVAHPFGGPELAPLRYTHNDVERMRDVLTRFGGFAEDDVLVSLDDDADSVTSYFDDVKARLAGAAGEETLFVFYYSGHAKDGALRLGDSALALEDVKALTQQTGASLKVAVIDACRAGGITRIKGAQKGAPLDVQVADEAMQSGQVFITASSEHEDAQESDDIQGSFFTYHLTSALRGTGDSNKDGRISLSEAYAHAYAQTVLATAGSKGGVQHPSYRFDLRGKGDVMLTLLERAESSIVFPRSAAGHFIVFDKKRRVVVAELNKISGEEVLVAVAPGRYVVKKRDGERLHLGELTVVANEEAEVDLSALREVSLRDDYAKGVTISLDELQHGRLGIRLALTGGAQSFLSTPARQGYFPNISLVGLQLDFDNLLRKDLGLRLDIATGSSGASRLVIRDPDIGTLNLGVRGGQVTTGAALVYGFPLTRRLTLAGLFRLGLVVITRTFDGDAFAPQLFSTLTPALGGELRFRLLDWLHVGAQARAHYMFFNQDTPQSLAYIDGAVVVTAVLR